MPEDAGKVEGAGVAEEVEAAVFIGGWGEFGVCDGALGEVAVEVDDYAAGEKTAEGDGDKGQADLAWGEAVDTYGVSDSGLGEPGKGGEGRS